MQNIQIFPVVIPRTPVAGGGAPLPHLPQHMGGGQEPADQHRDHLLVANVEHISTPIIQ